MALEPLPILLSAGASLLTFGAVALARHGFKAWRDVRISEIALDGTEPQDRPEILCKLAPIVGPDLSPRGGVGIPESGSHSISGGDPTVQGPSARP